MDRMFSFSIRKFVLCKTNQLLDYVEVQLVPPGDEPDSNPDLECQDAASSSTISTPEKEIVYTSQIPGLNLSESSSQIAAKNSQSSHRFSTNQHSGKISQVPTNEAISCHCGHENCLSGVTVAKTRKMKYNLSSRFRRPNSVVGIIEETRSADELDSDSDSAYSQYSTKSCPTDKSSQSGSRRKNVSFNLEPQIVLFKCDSNTTVLDDVRTLSLPSLFGSPKMKIMIQTRRPSRSLSLDRNNNEPIYGSGSQKRSELSRIIRYD